MDTYTIGIVVENDYKDILYYDNSFIIDIDISNKDVTYTIENKLEEILVEKAFRIDSISKKIPKLTISNEYNSTENRIMYLVKVYMYSDNSDFKSREYVLDSITIPLYRDYFLKYFIRYDKYNNLVNSYINVLVLIFYIMLNFRSPFGIRLPYLFNNLWINMLVYVAIPMIIVYKFIVPSILNYLIKYDISEKMLKINRFIALILWIVYIVMIVFIF